MAGKTTTQRGLGWDHQKQRDRLIRAHVDGTICWWCGLPMFKTQRLEADHSLPRSQGGTKADRLLHGYNQNGSRCNQERGNGSRDHLRPSLTGEPMNTAPVDTQRLGHRAMSWP